MQHQWGFIHIEWALANLNPISELGGFGQAYSVWYTGSISFKGIIFLIVPAEEPWLSSRHYTLPLG